MEMVKVSPLPVGPLSVTSATKVQGAPLFRAGAATMAGIALISSELSITLRTSVPFAGFTNCRPPLCAGRAGSPDDEAESPSP